ncbi:MAG: hypothetical protein LBI03_01115, partial [Clostridiales bacterium]|nr:hypothetical protein [Clostridiales bacterium]
MDKELIEAYILAHGKNLTRLCLQLCKNTDNADDLYQNTWYNAIRYFNTWDSDRPFNKWLYSICFNAYKHMCKKFNDKNLQQFSDNDAKENFINNFSD